MNCVRRVGWGRGCVEKKTKIGIITKSKKEIAMC
jgi:hypothetical protein